MMGNTRENNKTYGWIKRKHSQEKSLLYTGRTKETHEYLKLNGKKRKQLSKENCQWIQEMADKQKGRTKETHDSIKNTADKQRGRSKENFDYLKQRSEFQKTLTKETSIGRKITAKKLSICSQEQELELFNLKENGLSNKEIHKLFNEKGIKIAYSTISTIYRRLKKQFTK